MIDLSKRVGHGWRPNRTLERCISPRNTAATEATRTGRCIRRRIPGSGDAPTPTAQPPRTAPASPRARTCRNRWWTCLRTGRNSSSSPSWRKHHDPDEAREYAFRANPYGMTNQYDLSRQCRPTSSATSRESSARQDDGPRAAEELARATAPRVRCLGSEGSSRRGWLRADSEL